MAEFSPGHLQGATVAVTGASGNVGTALLRRLTALADRAGQAGQSAAVSAAGADPQAGTPPRDASAARPSQGRETPPRAATSEFSPVRRPDGSVVGGAPGQIESPPPASPRAPIRVGGQIQAPVKIKDVKPVYPPDARAAGVKGLVILEATIGVDGRVADAKVLRSVAGLDEAAVGAVRQWEFTPTLLNGVPTPIVMSVTVNFTGQ